jgi:hypothetical protein
MELAIETSFDLLTSEIKEFLRLTRHIKPQNNVNPMLFYIKLENKVLTKTSLLNFCQYTMSVDTHYSALLEENVLSSFLGLVSDKSFKVTIREKDIVLSTVSEGKTLKMKFPKQNAAKYPAPTLDDSGREYQIDTKVLTAIKYAKHSINKFMEFTPYNYIHLIGHYVFASDALVTFSYKSDMELPSIVLGYEAACLLEQFETISHRSGENYDFFSRDNVVYGFAKPTITTPPVFKKIVECLSREVFCKVKREDIVNFCEAVIATTSGFPDCYMEKAIQFRSIDKDLHNDSDMSFKAEGNYQLKRMYFSPKLFVNFLKSVPYESICLSPFVQEGFYFCWTEEDMGFVALLPGQKEK